MSHTIIHRAAEVFRVRSRAAVVSAGVCASVALTGGVAVAAEASPSETLAAQQITQDWVSPIGGDYVLSAPYGNSGDRWASTHSGQDFAVPSGTPVQSVHGGTVVKAGAWGAGDGSAYGNAVVVQHDDATYTQYAHLSEVQVSVGERVGTGEQIGLSGNTGNSSGPHLHFEVRTTADYGSAVDPVAFLHDEGLDI